MQAARAPGALPRPPQRLKSTSALLLPSQSRALSPGRLSRERGILRQTQSLQQTLFPSFASYESFHAAGCAHQTAPAAFELRSVFQSPHPLLIDHTMITSGFAVCFPLQERGFRDYGLFSSLLLARPHCVLPRHTGRLGLSHSGP